MIVHVSLLLKKHATVAVRLEIIMQMLTDIVPVGSCVTMSVGMKLRPTAPSVASDMPRGSLR